MTADAAQYAFRAQKSVGLADGPSFEPSNAIPAETAGARTIVYSEDGSLFAFALANSVQVLSAATGSTAAPVIIDQANVLALKFSPLSKTLFTFERPIKSDTDVHKNVKAWNVTTGELQSGWYQKTQEDWEPIVTADEAHLIRPTASDLLVFTPPLSTRPATRLKLDGQVRGLYLSRPSALPEQGTVKPMRPNSEPALAVWVGERKGAPASIALYPLSQLIGAKGAAAANGDVAAPADAEIKTENRDMPMTMARKAFYKADKVNLKWNHAGTTVLFLTQTDADTTGKSYYGETNLYVVALDGSYDGMVELDKEGPIYDFCWSPTSREFSVTYGYMPARTQLFDHKAKPVHSFGANPRNFLLYQPQGRLLLSAGFGNLAGGVDVWEISTRKKVAEFKASNSSHCEWSPCGRYILTATCSPRLRVDNGVKIWWAGGQLLHIHLQDELYNVTFRPARVETLEPFPTVVPRAPEPNASVATHLPKGEETVAPGGPATRPVGAYRPPGARGSAASDAYRRDEDSAPSSGASTPMFRGGKPSARYIPGASIPGAGPPGSAPKDAGGEKKKRQRTKNKKGGDAADDVAEAVAKLEVAAAAAPDEDAAQKKIRNLTKKLKAIDDLKARVAKGEALEKTQLQKIDTEDEVRGEIRALGGEA